MSGHSKWSTIKRQKGAADAKRGKLFTKLANTITIAVRDGGGVADPGSNPRLRLAVETARANNMPKENIERAIQRASGKAGESVEEAVYEGFGPGGFSVIVEAVTDNKMRTVSEVKNTFDKNGGSMGNVGSVSYQFVQKGQATVPKEGRSLDDIFIVAADSGAEDVEEAGDEVLIYTKPEELGQVRNKLSDQGFRVSEATLIRKPVVTVPIQDNDVAKKALLFMEKMEALDDVQEVYANFDIPDTLLTRQ